MPRLKGHTHTHARTRSCPSRDEPRRGPRMPLLPNLHRSDDPTGGCGEVLKGFPLDNVELSSFSGFR